MLRTISRLKNCFVKPRIIMIDFSFWDVSVLRPQFHMHGTLQCQLLFVKLTLIIRNCKVNQCWYHLSSIRFCMCRFVKLRHSFELHWFCNQSILVCFTLMQENYFCVNYKWPNNSWMNCSAAIIWSNRCSDGGCYVILVNLFYLCDRTHMVTSSE